MWNGTPGDAGFKAAHRVLSRCSKKDGIEHCEADLGAHFAHGLPLGHGLEAVDGEC
jgi:hypothetical protein